MTAIIAFASGGMAVAMWLGSRLARVTTDRNRLQAVVDVLRAGEKSLVSKITQLTGECVSFQQAAHNAQDGLDMAKDMLSSEIAAHKATKRQLAAAKGQITKLKRRIEG